MLGETNETLIVRPKDGWMALYVCEPPSLTDSIADAPGVTISRLRKKTHSRALPLRQSHLNKRAHPASGCKAQERDKRRGKIVLGWKKEEDVCTHREDDGGKRLRRRFEEEGGEKGGAG